MELIVKDVEGVALEDLLNKIIHEDCLEVMRRVPSEILDVVFFDFPLQKICDRSIGMEVNKH